MSKRLRPWLAAAVVLAVTVILVSPIVPSAPTVLDGHAPLFGRVLLAVIVSIFTLSGLVRFQDVYSQAVSPSSALTFIFPPLRR